MSSPPTPNHVRGNAKGEEQALKKKEPGRGGKKAYRTARDSTSINPENCEPILPEMPNIPPA